MSKDIPTAAEMVDALDAASRERLAAVTVHWDENNNRRSELIDRDVLKDGLSLLEAVELEQLQRLCDLRISLVAPKDFTVLAELEWRIKHGETKGDGS